MSLALGWSEVKLFWQYANNNVRLSIENNRLTQYAGFSAVPVLPGSVAEHHRTGCRWQIFSGMEVTPKHRGYPQRPEEAVRTIQRSFSTARKRNSNSW